MSPEWVFGVAVLLMGALYCYQAQVGCARCLQNGQFEGGSLVGVWNGWGYGIAFFRALKFKISEPEIWQKPLCLRNFRDFPANFGL